MIAIVVFFVVVLRWLAPKLGLPADATNVLLFIVALLALIYILKNGIPGVF